MSQAIQNIAAATASDKGATDTAMGQAMKAAAPRKPAKSKAKPAAKAAPASAPAQQPAKRTAPEQRGPITMADAVALCPHQGLANNLARTFALESVDMLHVRTTTDQSIRDGAAALTDTLNERALAMHLQRIVGAFVGSAYGAGKFYSDKVTQARDLTAKIANEDRDEDREGVSGFDSRATRARQFAAEMGIQAATLLAAAEGALDAYEHLTGETWKPYDTRRPDNTRTVSRRAAAEEMDAFNK
ncbi:Hypothetical protein HVPorG_03927 (plasmid) [Roseomonas mucosa]|uniref:hypothetical protein n=1 Tax=Roseomonas mucosa TaxID=207340 RepID=UPI0021FDA964|nr:hypothetical protein [Roseomonas mucosa]QDJ12031.1 Hypothetical protein HVPorG_03927 [Roseomonas mucosa]